MLNIIHKLKVLIVLVMVCYPGDPYTVVVAEVLREEIHPTPKFVAIEENLQCHSNQ